MLLNTVSLLYGIGGSDVMDEGNDYRNTPVVVTFEAGSNFSSYASIPIVLDNIQEFDEKFKATFELPDGYRNLNKSDPKDVETTIEDKGLYDIDRCVPINFTNRWGKWKRKPH